MRSASVLIASILACSCQHATISINVVDEYIFVSESASATDLAFAKKFEDGIESIYPDGFYAVVIATAQNLGQFVEKLDLGEPGIGFALFPCGLGDSGQSLFYSILRPIINEPSSRYKSLVGHKNLYIAYFPNSLATAAKREFDIRGENFLPLFAEAKRNGICVKIRSVGFAKLTSLNSNEVKLDFELR